MSDSTGATLALEDQVVSSLLEREAAERPDRVLVRFADRVWTAAEFRERVAMTGGDPRQT